MRRGFAACVLFRKRAVAVRFFITFAGPNRKPVQPDPVRTFFHF